MEVLDARIRAHLTSTMSRFADCLSEALAYPMRTNVQVQLRSVAAARFGELALKTDNPTCLQILKAADLEGCQLLEIHPEVLFPMIDRLLGGGRHPAPVMRRPLTPIEARLTGRLTQHFLERLAAAWHPVLSGLPTVVGLECNPRTLRLYAASEPMVVADFLLVIPPTKGRARFAFRRSSLTAAYGRIERSQAQSPAEELKVIVARTTMSRGKIGKLQVGDTLTTRTRVTAPAEVHIRGRLVYTARVGTHQGKKAVRIEGRAAGVTT
jgi:flagellar motor switch protein FliM